MVRPDSSQPEAAKVRIAPSQPSLGAGFPLHHALQQWGVRHWATFSRAAFHATVLYAGLLFWIAARPPMADLPQHAGQIALLIDLLDGMSPWEPLLRVNPLTPYLIGYALAVPLALVMPVAAALKLLLSLAFYAFVAACVALRRHFGGDPRLDWVFIPSFFGFAYAWGFFTFLLAVPLGLVFLLVADRYAAQPTVRGAMAVAGAGLLVFFSHGLVFLFVACIGACLVLARQKSAGRIARALLAYLPLAAVSIAYAIVVQAPGALSAAWPDGVWWRDFGSRLAVMRAIFGYSADHLQDTIFLAAAAVVVLWAPKWLGLRLNTAPAALVPLATVILVWVAAPFYAMKTAFLYERFSLFMLPFMCFAYRAPPAGSAAGVGLPRAVLVQCLLAFVCWGFLAGQAQRLLAFDEEARDFDRVRTGLEDGRRALYIPLDKNSEGARSTIAYEHYALWYQAENGGLVDFNFAWAHSQAVRYREDRLPSVRPYWKGLGFDWRQDEAWRYRYIFVRASAPLPDTFFENDQCEVALLRRAGSWAVYEVRHCRENAR